MWGKLKWEGILIIIRSITKIRLMTKKLIQFCSRKWKFTIKSSCRRAFRKKCLMVHEISFSSFLEREVISKCTLWTRLFTIAHVHSTRGVSYRLPLPSTTTFHVRFIKYIKNNMRELSWLPFVPTTLPWWWCSRRSIVADFGTVNFFSCRGNVCRS